jgi:hypothetical protein
MLARRCDLSPEFGIGSAAALDASVQSVVLTNVSQTLPSATNSTIAPTLDRAAHQFCVGVRAVDLGSVDVGDAQIERAVDRADGFGIATGADVVVAGH